MLGCCDASHHHKLLKSAGLFLGIFRHLLHLETAEFSEQWH